MARTGADLKRGNLTLPIWLPSCEPFFIYLNLLSRPVMQRPMCSPMTDLPQNRQTDRKRRCSTATGTPTRNPVTLPSYIQSILPQTRHADTGQTLRNATTNTTIVSKTSSFNRSFLPNSTKQWNLLPEAVRSEPSLRTFKKQLHELYCIPIPPEFFSFGSKTGNIYHTKVRCESLDINSYLFKIKKVE